MNKRIRLFGNKELNNFVRITLLLAIAGYLLFKILDSYGFFIEQITCDAEEVVKKNDKEFLASNVGYLFDKTKGRTNERAFEGNYSIKLTPTNQYGMSITFDTPKDNEEIEASVWYNMHKISPDTSGYAFIVVSVGKNFWKGGYEAIEKKNGWGKLSLKVTIPKANYHDPIVVYCWNSTKNDVFFDNMTIKRNNYFKFFRQEK